jgi:membrane protease subunit HflC
MAEKIRSEGQGEAQRIAGDKERDLMGIQSEAYRTAQEIKGKADAEATRIYAEAYTMDPEYYSFTKTLDLYKSSLNEKSKLVLSTDSEFLQYLKDFSNP